MQVIYIGSYENACTEQNWQPGTMPAMLIATAARLLGRIADTRLRELGISTTHFPVLVALKDGARLSQKELTRLAGNLSNPAWLSCWREWNATG